MVPLATKGNLHGEDRRHWDLLRRGHHPYPHNVLGVHSLKCGKRVLRLWRPGKQQGEVRVKIGNELHAAPNLAPGYFQLQVPDDLDARLYQIDFGDGRGVHDPYSFSPTFSELDCYLFNRGTHYEIFEKMGARRCCHEGVLGTSFAVWAPNAQRVSLVADFNFWDGLAHPMRRLSDCGVWELFMPGIDCGERYKFELITCAGEVKIKADPYALQAQLRPDTASIVAQIDSTLWRDDAWMRARAQRTTLGPMSVYEVHLGSWRRSGGNDPLNYRQIAQELAEYAVELGFTHVEILPITEYPLDESWGYQVGGYFAATCRYGTLEDFQYFINHLHERGIGVILDWIPGHFVRDEHGLSHFDGTALYEHDDERRQTHPHWGTRIFNHARSEVSNLLIASALFWLSKWHIDGLRVDAVASMLYLDYGKENEEWIPNEWGGRENLEAVEFLKHLNAIVGEKVSGALMIAEESTSWEGVTAPLKWGGLGFDLKWNMGWMNDTLRYFARECLFRGYHQGELTNGLLYAFSERFALVLSHDEVVHGKGSLLSKMPGDLWQKFANLRLLYSYMICQPGKNLIFMGGEWGVWREWQCNCSLEWALLDQPLHRGLHELVKTLNRLYLATSALWQRDDEYSGFEWIDFNDIYNCVISYFRIGNHHRVACIHNFTPSYHPAYKLCIPGAQTLREIFNSDSAHFGGSGKGNNDAVIAPESGNIFCLVMPPLATMIFEVDEGTRS